MRFVVSYLADDGRQEYVLGDIEDREFRHADFMQRIVRPTVETIKVKLFPEDFQRPKAS